MKSPRTLRQQNYKKLLKEQVETNPNARKIAKRYGLMRYLLAMEWEGIMSYIPQEQALKFLQDVVYIDRQIRKATEGYDELNKKIQSQEFQLKEGLAEI